MIVLVILCLAAGACVRSRKSTIGRSAPFCLVVSLVGVNQFAMLGASSVLDEHEVRQGGELGHETNPGHGHHPVANQLEAAPRNR